MSKSRPKGASSQSSNPFALPGLEGFGNFGNILNFDPSAIEKQINNVNEEDIDDDELEKELLALNSNSYKKIERKAPKPDKKLQV